MMNKGIYNKGKIKRTSNQVKKHVSQMNDEEKCFLVEALKKSSLNLTFTNHFYSNGVDCKEEDVIALLSRENLKELIVEYNETIREGVKDSRVLVRDTEVKEVLFRVDDKNKKEFKQQGNLCVVVSILTGNVITAYWNIATDKHTTLNWNRYNADLEILRSY